MDTISTPIMTLLPDAAIILEGKFKNITFSFVLKSMLFIFVHQMNPLNIDSVTVGAIIIIKILHFY
jgi:hypothetical protein